MREKRLQKTAEEMRRNSVWKVERILSSGNEMYISSFYSILDELDGGILLGDCLCTRSSAPNNLNARDDTQRLPSARKAGINSLIKEIELEQQTEQSQNRHLS